MIKEPMSNAELRRRIAQSILTRAPSLGAVEKYTGICRANLKRAVRCNWNFEIENRLKLTELYHKLDCGELVWVSYMSLTHKYLVGHLAKPEGVQHRTVPAIALTPDGVRVTLKTSDKLAVERWHDENGKRRPNQVLSKNTVV